MFMPNLFLFDDKNIFQVSIKTGQMSPPVLKMQNVDLTKPEQTDNALSDFIGRIKKDSNMRGLSLSSRKALWDRIGRQNKSYDRRFIKLLVWSGSIAASICLLLTVNWDLLFPPQPVTVDYAGIMQSFEPVDDASGNVQLVLSNNQKIPIAGQEAQVDYDEEGQVNINQNEKMKTNEGIEDDKIAYHQLVVPAGKRTMLSFNDGTKVWINSGSKVAYPVTFAKDKREIFVEGEIYLDVQPDAERPFFVHTGEIGVRVLGTQFNVSAYTDQRDLQVVLVSGEVEICRKDNATEILQPNQLYSYNEERKDYTISVVDAADYIAWKDGYYPFYSQDLGTVLAKLSKYYAVQFKWSEKIKTLSCSGKLDLKEDLQEVIKTLEKTAPVEFLKTAEREYTVIVKP